MTHDNHGHTNGFALGLLCGVAVGAALGLLFAPSDGKQLRGKIGENARWLGDQSKEMYDRANRTVNDAMHAGRDAFQKARTDATASADM